MKRTAEIKLGLLAATAAALAGCGGVDQPHYDVHRQCVDSNQVVVDDRYCRQTTGRSSGVYGYPYRWYYYGGGARPAAYGSHAAGGSFSAPAASRAASGTVRGVFGGTAAGHGFGGGAGE